MSDTILERVQKNPEIGTDDAEYVSQLVARAKRLIVEYCNIPTFPDSFKAASIVGGIAAESNISSAGSNQFRIYLPDQTFDPLLVTLDLSVCVDGDSTASELQSKIRSVSTNSAYSLVEVSYDASEQSYTISSGRSSDHAIFTLYDVRYHHVLRALRLHPDFGAVFHHGSVPNEELMEAAAMLCEVLYRRIGQEGLRSGSMLDGSFTAEDWPAHIRRILNANRRLF